MAAIISSYIFLLFHCNPISLHFQQQMNDPILSFAFVIFSVTFSLFCFILISLSIYKRVSKTEEQQRKGHTQNPEQFNPSLEKRSLSKVVDVVHSSPENGRTQLARSLLLEVLPSDSTKWASLLDDKGCDDPKSISSGLDSGREGSGEEQRGKKKKKKAKKKKVNSIGEDSAEEKGGGIEKTGSDSGVRLESVCLYPFTSSSSAMQRKIKQQYDELVKCHESKKLTLAQVVQFANSLVDARNELQHKADVIQRKFIITKALLFKADRSSFDRLRQQIYKLELEQKRLEEDAFVYNWLQQQLKLSPAYKKMLEIGACMEKTKSHEPNENTDDEFSDISFEELLAQEKKDSFWQRNGKSRLCSS